MGNKIFSRKVLDKRCFYKNSSEIAYYDIEDSGKRGIKVNIYLVGREILTGGTSVGLWKTDWKRYPVSWIKQFLRRTLGKGIAVAMYPYLLRDFGFFDKEKVVFT